MRCPCVYGYQVRICQSCWKPLPIQSISPKKVSNNVGLVDNEWIIHYNTFVAPISYLHLHPFNSHLLPYQHRKGQVTKGTNSPPESQLWKDLGNSQRFVSRLWRLFRPQLPSLLIPEIQTHLRSSTAVEVEIRTRYQSCSAFQTRLHKAQVSWCLDHGSMTAECSK